MFLRGGLPGWIAVWRILVTTSSVSPETDRPSWPQADSPSLLPGLSHDLAMILTQMVIQRTGPEVPLVTLA